MPIQSQFGDAAGGRAQSNEAEPASESAAPDSSESTSNFSNLKPV
jgi:hypothetical protein